MTGPRMVLVSAASLVLCLTTIVSAGDKRGGLHIAWKKNYLTITGPDLPGKVIRVNYLEAFCRLGSTDRLWSETTIPHKTELVSADKQGKRIQLKSTLNDGVIVQHTIRAGRDEVDFRLVASNRTQTTSQAHWAQPCIRLEKFTGRTQKTYLPKGFIFLGGKLTRMPTPHWATQARYIPGQVWVPEGVNRNDVNPRPLSSLVPSNGLIGCFSADEKKILAVAWEPYQELFQGVIVCLHSDFHIGSLKPGETKQIRGKIYVMDADVGQLLSRYRKDFPEQVKPSAR